jgi:hypothetical protein
MLYQKSKLKNSCFYNSASINIDGSCGQYPFMTGLSAGLHQLNFAIRESKDLRYLQKNHNSHLKLYISEVLFQADSLIVDRSSIVSTYYVHFVSFNLEKALIPVIHLNVLLQFLRACGMVQYYVMEC